MEKSFNVINLRGEEEPFSAEKVYQSAKRTGASDQLAEEIVKNVKKIIRPGIKTSRIFDVVKRGLGKENARAAIRFSLKKSIERLGPTGFPFEKYIKAIFEESGYGVDINQYIQGKCITYEVDFLAKKGKTIYVGECKYRNLPQQEAINLTITLANFAKFLDLKEGGFFKQKQFGDCEVKSLLVTNSKFSSDSINFSKCREVGLLGWRYPNDKGLEYFIESQGLYPITILPSLSGYLSHIFVSSGLMLVKDIFEIDIQKFSKENRIPQNKIEPLIEEAKILLNRV